MAIMKISIFIIAMTMALTIAMITMRSTTQVKQKLLASEPEHKPETTIQLPSKRVSRFLASTNANPRATAIKCNKDNELCDAIMGRNYKCCNNKCMDLSTDKHNCGSCKNKCKFTEACCRGECVDLNYDKRHCGECNNPCKLCLYGQCNYA